MLEAYAAFYPYIVLSLGCFAGFGSLVAGAGCGLLALLGCQSDDLVNRSIFGALFNALGCAGAIGALAATKYVLGL